MLNLSARDLVIVAHRGANHLAPENTIAATEKCIELGVAYVEIDVRTSKDGVFYILHDKTLDRTTNGTGAIAERNSEYIDNLDAGSWFSPDFAGQHVPKLKPYLERFKGKIKVYFDVKGADLSKLVKLVHKTGFEKDCFFWFSNDDKARELRAIDPDIPLKMNAVDIPGLKRVLDYNPQIIEYRLDHLTPSFVAFCRDHKLKLMAHALHKGAESDYQRIIDSAADMVNLDKADVMIELLKE
jgi:glycerophosphoryl diester phosphodiesterase